MAFEVGREYFANDYRGLRVWESGRGRALWVQIHTYLDLHF